MKVTLKFTGSDGSKEHTLNMGETVLIGRSTEADVQFSYSNISGKHFRLTLKNDRLELQDLESKNGTYLNGIRIDQSEVFIGDEIRFGSVSIKLEDSHVDDEANKILTFPGPFKDRISNELKMDFTGARLKNQQESKKPGAARRKMDESQLMEIAVRKKFKSKIRLSKEQIRSKYKLTALMATLFDIVFLFCILAIPVILMSHTVPETMPKKTRAFLFFSLEGIFIGAYYLTNFKVAKFTMGEKLLGIQKYYLEQ